MARRDSLGQSDPELPLYYNLDHAVGRGEFRPYEAPDEYTDETGVSIRASNRKDDVMLVQFFLMRLGRSSPLFSPPDGEMVVDGIWGPISSRWLTAFQMQAREAGWVIKVDGRADPARGAQSSISSTRYTILHLNSTFKGAEPATDFVNLYKDDEVPFLLKGSIAPR